MDCTHRLGVGAFRAASNDKLTAWRPEPSGKTILEIEVRGKRGVGYGKSMAGAVTPFRRLMKRNAPSPTDAIFGKTPWEMLNTVLGELGLKRTATVTPPIACDTPTSACA
jgi:hypothetical protein